MGAVGVVPGSIVSNSHSGKRSAAWVMTTFVSRVGPHILNIEYFGVYGGTLCRGTPYV